ncbi:DNA polymerase IV [Solwaraspora sp. WMMD406]|uniref:DNA polymerase IV n=1 Tax=Solwaraspora sp. WMMD406 TaxID=3016095 RepID=UPI002416F8B2|nr:DNA polymerase IV [Solwaraspora sp. WMMD406]MDG4767294.1 DNA polymerase IV [Solwaraspora sp. WMMD406]
MADEASILHADLDAFYASVEQRDDPRLRDRPVIVGAGVVLAASYEAKTRGVRTAMPGQRARLICPEAVVVPPRMSAYTTASRAVFEVFRQTTPLVEPLSIDEAFLDVGGLRRLVGAPADIAARLRVAVRDQVGLPITVGVARTKFLAKVASGVAKPDGLLVVPPSGELDFLHPLPVERLWGVGPVTAGKLRERGITTVGRVARLGEAALVAMLGAAAGRHLHALAHNQDPRRVQVGHRRGSIGSQQALGRAARDGAEVDAILAGLVDRVGRRMRAAGRTGRTVTLRLRFGDFGRATRAHTLPRATAQTSTILDTARDLLAAAAPMIGERGLTLIGVSVGNLDGGQATQLTLPFDPADAPPAAVAPKATDAGQAAAAHPGNRQESLDAALDAVRDRFGSRAVNRAVLLGRDLGPAVPLLPD